jgi:GT2 family glycosyltransferase
MIAPMQPRVTWMIPVLNGMPYITQTLASIEAQTFKPAQIIVWDNGSSDGTIQEVARWIPARLPGILVSARPLPLGLARAAMVNLCTTEFAALIDADDVNHPDRLERQMQFMDAHPDVAVVGAQLRRINSLGEPIGCFGDYPLKHEYIVQEMLRSNPIGQPSVLFRRAAVIASGNYRDFPVEDYDLWLRMAGAKYRLANLPERLIDYRVHERSTTQKSITANRLETECTPRLCEAAPLLFGCSSGVMSKLKSRQHPLAILPLVKIAEHIRCGEDPWKSEIFCRAARTMIHGGDAVSRTFVAVAEGGLAKGIAEVGATARDMIRFAGRAARKCREEKTVPGH